MTAGQYMTTGRAQMSGTLGLGSAAARTFTVGLGVPPPPGYDMDIDAVISGGAANMAFTKAGAGTLRLRGANTYDGTTAITGSLILNGAGTLGTPAGWSKGFRFDRQRRAPVVCRVPMPLR